MKAKILGTALFATLVLGANLAYAKSGEPSPLQTKGNVTVEEGTFNPGDDKPIDPENPDKKIPDGTVTPNDEASGPLEITHAADINFAKVKTSTNQVISKADAIKYNDGEADQVRGAAYVQFGDLRTSANGYTVKVAMKNQFTQGTNILHGATIDFADPVIATQTGATGVAPKSAKTFQIGEENGAVEIANTDEEDSKSGKGLWAIEYGSSKGFGADNTKDTTGESVTLTIPGYTASSMASGNYVATLEWSITAAP